MSVNEKMTAIADNIRSKTGGTEALTLDDMARSVNEVYEEGYKESQTTFVSMLSNDGVRTMYRYLFENADFSGYTFDPKIYPTRLGSVFYNYAGKELPSGIDFSKAIIAETVTDTAIIPYQTFAYTRQLERIPDMNIPVQHRYTYTYRQCYAKKIDIIRVAETTTFSDAFTECKYLKDVTFEGVIGRNISFSDSPLTVESIKNILLHLKNNAGTDNAGKYTLTLKDSCKTLMAQQGAIAELGGKTYDAYITDIGWNLA